MARTPKDTAASVKPANKRAIIEKGPTVENRKFTPETKLSELTLKDLSNILRAEIAAAGLSGTHVNSGPPGFVNGGGHANFDPGSSGGSHVNSGPPGFVNGGGHANFDPSSVMRPGSNLTRVTLPGGLRVDVPATGRFDMTVRGTRITR